MRKNYLAIILLLVTIISVDLQAQNQELTPKTSASKTAQSGSVVYNMTLNDVIETAREQSLLAMMAKHNFIVDYWRFRSYKAQFLPSLNLGGELGQYNRSLVAVQNSETGEINYVNNDNLKNSLNLSIDQNIALTGGTVSLYTSLSRLDQFAPNKNVTYNSQPINISYNQPLKAFNTLKWEKKIEPKKFEKAKTEYLESMENVTVFATQYFFDLLISQKGLDMAIANDKNTKQLYAIAQERFKIGSISKDELLQLKLSMLTNEISLRDKELAVQSKMLKLRNFLGYNERVELKMEVPEAVDNLSLNFDDVIHNVNTNSSFSLTNSINQLEAEKEVARAKASSGLQAEIFARFGLTQIGNNLSNAYKSPLDQEVVGLSVKLPIMDWGLGKGRVKVAKSQEKVVDLQTEQTVNEKYESVLFKVMQFNIQGSQCAISAEADTIGRERYVLTRERFQNGTINVTELNTAQNEMDNAIVRHLQDLQNYWNFYYDIRRLSLYDYFKNVKLTEDFEKLSGENQ